MLFSGFCGDFCGYAHNECQCRSPACNQIKPEEIPPFSPAGYSTITPLPQDQWRTWSRLSNGFWTVIGTPSITPPTLPITYTTTGISGTSTVTTTWSWPEPEPEGPATTTPPTSSPLGHPVVRQTDLDPFSVTDAAESSLLAEEYVA